MEAVGAVASIVSIVELAASLASKVKKVCIRLKDAPTEYSAFQAHLCIVLAIAVQLERLLASPTLTTSDKRGLEVDLLEHSLHAALRAVGDVETLFDTVHPVKDRLSRARWVLQHRQPVTEALARLQAAQVSLCLLLQLLSLYVPIRPGTMLQRDMRLMLQT